MTTLTPAKAAELLGRRPQTLAVWRCKGDGPPFRKVYGRILYDEDEVRAWAKLPPVERRTMEGGR